jgi:hypothetical protein
MNSRVDSIPAGCIQEALEKIIAPDQFPNRVFLDFLYPNMTGQ